MKVMLKVKVSSLLIIISLQVITDSALCIVRELIKQRNQRFIMMKKLNVILQCFNLIKVNIKVF